MSEIAGGIISGIGQAAGSIVSAVGQHKDRDVNKAFAKENLYRQHRYNQNIWQREDSAVQRRVADLKKAGLSPVLAAGSPAQVMGGGAAQNAYQAKNHPLGEMKGMSESILNSVNAAYAILKQKKDISKTVSEEKLIHSKLKAQQHDNAINKKFGTKSNEQLGAPWRNIKQGDSVLSDVVDSVTQKLIDDGLLNPSKGYGEYKGKKIKGVQPGKTPKAIVEKDGEYYYKY